jgi:PAS domain-containing protein
MIYNLLLIQSEPDDAQMVCASLKNSDGPAFRIEWVKSGAQGLARLAALAPDKLGNPSDIAAILVDLRLTDAPGLGIVDRLFAVAPQVPIVVLYSLRDEALAKSAIQRGAQDFLPKDHLDSYVLPKTLAAVIERAAITEALFAEKERAQVTLNSIGDAVISTDIAGRVTYMNLVAERLTGWPLKDSSGRPLEEIFKIIDAETRQTIANPMVKAAA